jgi:putative ribosome biogenesis GTPase RsgA
MIVAPQSDAIGQLLLLAQFSRLQPIIVLNKSDLPLNPGSQRHPGLLSTRAKFPY